MATTNALYSDRYELIDEIEARLRQEGIFPIGILGHLVTDSEQGTTVAHRTTGALAEALPDRGHWTADFEFLLDRECYPQDEQKRSKRICVYDDRDTVHVSATTLPSRPSE